MSSMKVRQEQALKRTQAQASAGTQKTDGSTPGAGQSRPKVENKTSYEAWISSFGKNAESKAPKTSASARTATTAAPTTKPLAQRLTWDERARILLNTARRDIGRNPTTTKLNEIIDQIEEELKGVDESQMTNDLRAAQDEAKALLEASPKPAVNPYLSKSSRDLISTDVASLSVANLTNLIAAMEAKMKTLDKTSMEYQELEVLLGLRKTALQKKRAAAKPAPKSEASKTTAPAPEDPKVALQRIIEAAPTALGSLLNSKPELLQLVQNASVGHTAPTNPDEEDSKEPEPSDHTETEDDAPADRTDADPVPSDHTAPDASAHPSAAHEGEGEGEPA